MMYMPVHNLLCGAQSDIAVGFSFLSLFVTDNRPLFIASRSILVHSELNNSVRIHVGCVASSMYFFFGVGDSEGGFHIEFHVSFRF